MKSRSIRHFGESERLERYRRECQEEWADENDQILAKRIVSMLDHPQLDEHCMVDAYYYDFSQIPRKIREEKELCRDSYLIFGITIEGELVSKWVERHDLEHQQ